MANDESRIPEKREYQGEEQARLLINWLNITPDKEGRARILEILQLYVGLSVQRAKMESGIYEKNGHYYEKETEQTSRRDELAAKLDTALSYYQMRPVIRILGPDGKPSEWNILTLWQAVPGSLLEKNSKKATAKIERAMREAPERFWIDDETAIQGSQMGEQGAIRTVLQLIESGLFWKVGPCRCGQFFFRRFQHQRFCSEKCRIAEFRNSDEARAKRNEYARRLYQLHKSGKVK